LRALWPNVTLEADWSFGSLESSGTFATSFSEVDLEVIFRQAYLKAFLVENDVRTLVNKVNLEVRCLFKLYIKI